MKNGFERKREALMSPRCQLHNYVASVTYCHINENMTWLLSLHQHRKSCLQSARLTFSLCTRSLQNSSKSTQTTSSSSCSEVTRAKSHHRSGPPASTPCALSQIYPALRCVHRQHFQHTPHGAHYSGRRVPLQHIISLS